MYSRRRTAQRIYSWEEGGGGDDGGSGGTGTSSGAREAGREGTHACLTASSTASCCYLPPSDPPLPPSPAQTQSPKNLCWSRPTLLHLTRHTNSLTLPLPFLAKTNHMITTRPCHFVFTTTPTSLHTRTATLTPHALIRPYHPTRLLSRLCQFTHSRPRPHHSTRAPPSWYPIHAIPRPHHSTRAPPRPHHFTRAQTRPYTTHAIPLPHQSIINYHHTHTTPYIRATPFYQCTTSPHYSCTTYHAHTTPHMHHSTRTPSRPYYSIRAPLRPSLHHHNVHATRYTTTTPTPLKGCDNAHINWYVHYHVHMSLNNIIHHHAHTTPHVNKIVAILIHIYKWCIAYICFNTHDIPSKVTPISMWHFTTIMTWHIYACEDTRGHWLYVALIVTTYTEKVLLPINSANK